MIDIDQDLRPDLAFEQIRAATEQSKTNRGYMLVEFINAKPCFPGSAEKPDLESEGLHKEAFDMALMAIAGLAHSTMDWLEREEEEREQEARDDRE